MRYLLIPALVGAFLAVGSPVSAQEAGLSTWIVEEPTSLLGGQTAELLPEGKGYFIMSASALPVAGGPCLVFTRGAGPGGQWLFDLAALTGVETGFEVEPMGAIGYKHQLVTLENAAAAVNGGLGARWRSGRVRLDASMGMPMTIAWGDARLSAAPVLAITDFAGNDDETKLKLNMTARLPVIPEIKGLLGLTPSWTIGHGPELLAGAGLRYSPTPDMHLDFTVGGLNSTPFTEDAGQVAMTGFVAF